jgi:hypothetical protein
VRPWSLPFAAFAVQIECNGFFRDAADSSLKLTIRMAGDTRSEIYGLSTAILASRCAYDHNAIRSRAERGIGAATVLSAKAMLGGHSMTKSAGGIRHQPTRIRPRTDRDGAPSVSNLARKPRILFS